MIPVVKDILRVKESVSAMEKLGYESIGEYGMLFRHFFIKREPGQFFNIHVFEENNPDIDRHLKFRDWMQTHLEDREAYEKLKINLASQFPNDIFGYVSGKDKFVESIDEKTGFDGIRAVLALKNQEWDAVRNFRQKYFFDLVPIVDPYTWTFKDKQHAHIILYKGIKIVGYAHIQFWPDKKAAMRIIVIDEPYRNQGFGSELLKICERWLKNQEIRILHVESRLTSYPFYKRHKYIEMSFDDPEGHETHPNDIAIGKVL